MFRCVSSPDTRIRCVNSGSERVQVWVCMFINRTVNLEGFKES